MPYLSQATRTPVADRLRRWDPARGALLLGCLLLVVAGLALGDRTSDYAELRSQVRAGDVDSIEVHGALPAGASGSTVVEIVWRDGAVRRVARARQAREEPGAPSTRSSSGDQVAREPTDPVATLVDLDPSLAVVRGQADPRSTIDVLGWSVPGWMFSMPLILVLGGLSLLVRRPEPWRATRWAWFWPMLLLPPLGVAAYAAFSGPGLSPAPREGARRLSGGWSFLVVCFVLVPLLT